MSAVRGFIQCEQGGGVLQMRTLALLVQKFRFFEIYGVSVRTNGGERDQFFAILRGEVFFGQLLKILQLSTEQ